MKHSSTSSTLAAVLGSDPMQLWSGKVARCYDRSRRLASTLFSHCHTTLQQYLHINALRNRLLKYGIYAGHYTVSKVPGGRLPATDNENEHCANVVRK